LFWRAADFLDTPDRVNTTAAMRLWFHPVESAESQQVQLPIRDVLKRALINDPFVAENGHFEFYLVRSDGTRARGSNISCELMEADGFKVK
jgi:hypothetical protein